MKKKLLVAAGILVLLLLLATQQRRSVETEVVIQAPPERVWAVLTDFPSYPEWNPVLPSVEGVLAEGSVLTAETVMGPGKTATFAPEVLRVREAEELRWRGGLAPGVMQGEHYWRLHAAAGGTRVEHGEHFRGLILFLLPWDKIRGDFEALNAALAERAEAGT